MPPLLKRVSLGMVLAIITPFRGAFYNFQIADYRAILRPYNTLNGRKLNFKSLDEALIHIIKKYRSRLLMLKIEINFLELAN